MGLLLAGWVLAYAIQQLVNSGLHLHCCRLVRGMQEVTVFVRHAGVRRVANDAGQQAHEQPQIVPFALEHSVDDACHQKD